jgi:colanic acid/amylovoran biosynthesis glycosyltransferase
MLDRLAELSAVSASATRRAAFVVSDYPVMSETFVMYSALGLIRNGWSVDVVPVGAGRESAEPRRETHPVEAELHGLRVLRPGAPARPGEALRRLWRHHGPAALLALDPTRFSRAAFTLKPLYVADVLSEGGPYDVVHCHFGNLAGPILELRRAGLFRAKVVVHFRGNDISRHVAAFGDHVYDEVFAEADWFVANSRHFRDRAIALGCDPARIDVVPSGCDVARFPFVDRPPPDGRPVRLLSVGRLVEKKGHSLAIAATRRLRADGRDVSLRIVGAGPMRDALEADAADLGDAVVFVGSAPHHAIHAELAAADVFLAPSVRSPDGDEDGPVNTVKEAMACGTPVVASRHGGIPELIRHGATGMLCAEGDAADLAAKIADTIAAADRWPDIRRAARADVEAKFSLDASTAKLASIYEKLSTPGSDA